MQCCGYRPAKVLRAGAILDFLAGLGADAKSKQQWARVFSCRRLLQNILHPPVHIFFLPWVVLLPGKGLSLLVVLEYFSLRTFVLLGALFSITRRL